MIPISKKSTLIYKDNVIYSPEIFKKIKLFSSYLHIKKGDRVCILSYNKPEWIYSFYSIWEKGGIPVPIDFMSSVEEIVYILEDSEPKYIFTDETNKKTVENAIKKSKEKPEILIFEQIKEEKKTEEKTVKTEHEDTAVILYTSGTTGSPKGVMLSFENLMSNIKGLEATNIADSTDSTVAILPFHHSYPLMVSMLFPLYIGAKIVFIEKISSEEILKALQDNKISVLIGVPRLYYLFHRKIFSQLNKNVAGKLLFFFAKNINNRTLSRTLFKKVHNVFGGNIKYFVSGGAKLDIEIAKDLWALGFTIIEGYGLTETSPIVSFNPPERIKLGSVGIPIKGVSVRIENGEVLVKGKNVMKGYWNKPEETQKTVKNGWLYTGDLGYLDEDGYLYITGRKKDIIVLPSGKNINPEELEQKILKISDLIKEVAVIYKDEKLTAVIYPDFETVQKENIVNIYETIKWDVIDRLNQELPDYKRISELIIVKKELPKTRLGKIRRFMLKDFIKNLEKPKEVKEPDYPEYQIIKEYLKSITKKEVYPDSHIEIDLGLDSLEKVEFLSFIEQSFGTKISEKELLENPTVEKISLLIKEKRKKIEKTEINWKDIFKQEEKVEISESKLPLIFLKKLLYPVFRLYFRLKIEGVENLPHPPFILAPNHQSFLDGFLIISALPDSILKNTYFLAEEKYFPEGIRKKIGNKFHVLTVNINKDLKGSLLKTASLLKKGKNVVIFPEGARTRDGNLLPFKKSFGILSKELNIPVVPVVISGAFESFPIGSVLPKPYKIKIKFLEPVHPEEKSVDKIVEETYHRIKESL
ncbi:long-chain acyl-CoA synthetase [Persephonella hydrogeniphila]|uniref:Long-chain acyl-CoA synthetase n=1 Tax=Persephonella hydrogeniphila TaxID=198703 RepID=A0A285NUS8_9AQUI|nr:AMP-binding protein [Persephonella hydrogeniphila]SNZ11636.1 long-chain acyl-CoA synthetase [Persephonella hydrogeniphila]